ncbi:MAG: glycerol-3-phosphate dehydrogenase/oxidase [Chloroflexota bacterium]|nr:glycerol-3-phosphate dehydrogenase/oxidase [Chloroflexota bacterium]
MKALSGETRAEHLRQMAAGRVDVCVIGGGITGAGVALEAASRGASVALIERKDFASGTSGWSTKLVHGGIRYLPQGQVALVREALHERATLLRIAPHLVWPLAFVLPIYDTTRRPIGVPISLPRGYGVGMAMEIGLTAYDLLAGKEKSAQGAPARHRHIPADEAVRDVPGLKTDGLKSAFVYSDAGTNDTKLVATIVRTAVEQGALVANYTEATGFVQENGRIVGVEARDTITGEAYTIAARHVVNATGVWAERVESLGTREPQVQVLPAKGIHLVVDAAKVGVTNDAVVLPETEDGRLIFIVPWQGRAVIGTTDTPGGDIERPRADADEIAYVLRTVNGSIRSHLTEADIISTYAGYRPLVRARDGAKSAALARTHAVLSAPNGLVTIVGGKLTTYRRMAQETLDTLELHGLNIRASVTDHLPLAGADGYGHWKRVFPAEAARRELDADVAAHLLQSYGADAPLLLAMVDDDALLAARMAPDLPVIFAETRFAARYEMAMTVEDVLARRTRLSLIDRAHGFAAAPDVAAILGDALGWDAAERTRQVETYRTTVADLHIPASASDSDVAMATMR